MADEAPKTCTKPLVENEEHHWSVRWIQRKPKSKSLENLVRQQGRGTAVWLAWKPRSSQPKKKTLSNNSTKMLQDRITKQAKVMLIYHCRYMRTLKCQGSCLKTHQIATPAQTNMLFLCKNANSKQRVMPSFASKIWFSRKKYLNYNRRSNT